MDSTPSNEEQPSVEDLRAQWVEQMEDFKKMTWAAEHGYKRACGGHPDRYDMDLYDREAEECARFGAILGAVTFAPDATIEDAREQARRALETHRTPANEDGRALARQYLWARAVVDGDARQYWSPYHPRFVPPAT